jgi:hypothetical protein
MPVIDLDQLTWDKLQLTARLTDQPIGAVVKMLVDRLAGAEAARSTEPPGPMTVVTSPPAARPVIGTDAWIPVHKIYKGNRVEGGFNPSTMELRVDTAPWSGKVFSAPTAAARAVVEHFPNDRETSNTNGRKFWKVTATGRDLRSIVGER